MQRMPHLRSAAFSLMIPTGTAYERDNVQGSAAITIEMMQRGAGSRSSRDIVEDLDFLGVERDAGVSTLHASVSAAMIDEYLPQTLQIYADIVQDAHLSDDQFPDAQATAMQELAALADDAAQRCFTRLRKVRYGQQYGRSSVGTQAGIETTTNESIQAFYANTIKPDGAILSIAGNIDCDETIEVVRKLFADWKPRGAHPKATIPAHAGYAHINEETSQTQIALAYDAVSYDHEKFYESRALVNILGDGMSSRLFTEVREKRGLVYTVSASTQSIGTRSSIIVYAGTTTARAEETLLIINENVRSLANGITEDEMRRLRARVKTSLVFEQESCSARCSQNATDWFYLGRIVPRSEILAKVDALSADILIQHAIDYPVRNETLVTLGEAPLKTQDGI